MKIIFAVEAWLSESSSPCYSGICQYKWKLVDLANERQPERRTPLRCAITRSEPAKLGAKPRVTSQARLIFPRETVGTEPASFI